jgi:hypothetical protein
MAATRVTREQLTVFLRAAVETFPRFAVLFLLMARTGLRLGEALALQWGAMFGTPLHKSGPKSPVTHAKHAEDNGGGGSLVSLRAQSS